MSTIHILYNASVTNRCSSARLFAEQQRTGRNKRRQTSDSSCGSRGIPQSFAREKMYGENFVDLTLSTSSFVTRLHSCA